MRGSAQRIIIPSRTEQCAAQISPKDFLPHLAWRACLVSQLSPALCDPMDSSLPGSSVHVISQAMILE